MSKIVNYMVNSSDDIDLGEDSADESELNYDREFEIEEKRPSQVKTPGDMISDDVVIDNNVTPPATTNDTVTSNVGGNYPVDNDSTDSEEARRVRLGQERGSGRRRARVRGGVFAGPDGQRQQLRCDRQGNRIRQCSGIRRGHGYN